ncbi:MAG: thioredoxin domain-containing protein [Candidatus Marinimicrobia bacterium]|nr:thioredoxin domain-containing protein [Candidatus Neomarinimicrobiota bacterium]
MKILILCTGNSCRSQMAEGFLKSFDRNLEVYSAGTEPATKINPFAVNVMQEVGLNISKNTTQSETKVTFIELGSVNCIPCKQMQPVMKAIEEKYPEQVKITFYDVWTKEGKPYAQQYKIRVIPTQVFLDSNGSEFFRHEGYFPLVEIEKLLQQKGVQ